MNLIVSSVGPLICQKYTPVQVTSRWVEGRREERGALAQGTDCFP